MQCIKKTNQWVSSGAAQTYGDEAARARQNDPSHLLYKWPFHHRILRFLLLQRQWLSLHWSQKPTRHWHASQLEPATSNLLGWSAAFSSYFSIAAVPVPFAAAIQWELQKELISRRCCKCRDRDCGSCRESCTMQKSRDHTETARSPRWNARSEYESRSHHSLTTFYEGISFGSSYEGASFSSHRASRISLWSASFHTWESELLIYWVKKITHSSPSYHELQVLARWPAARNDSTPHHTVSVRLGYGDNKMS